MVHYYLKNNRQIRPMAQPIYDALQTTLNEVRNKIQKIREKKENIGEQNTKAILIDPILTALGWNINNLEEVYREYRPKPQYNPVDYALFINRNLSLLIEAKSLEQDLSVPKWVTQILSYATVSGVDWCVLTNGDEYRIYNARAPVNADEKLFRKIQISVAKKLDFILDTLKLLTKDNLHGKIIDELWSAYFVDRQVEVTLRNMFDNEDEDLIQLIYNKLKKIDKTDIQASLRRANIIFDFPIISKPHDRPATPPIASNIEGSKLIRIADLIHAGLIDPPLELKSNYKQANLTATIQADGTIDFKGQSYNSPSIAGGFARNSVIGLPTYGKTCHQTNGWIFWEYFDKGTGKMETLDHLRQKYKKLKG